MSSRKGPHYPITEDWQKWVRARIEQMKRDKSIKFDADVARKAGIGKSTLSEALEDGAVWTAVMPEIHKALGWPAPLLTPPVRVLELVEAFDQLDDYTQGKWVEKVQQAASEEKARRRTSRASSR